MSDSRELPRHLELALLLALTLLAFSLRAFWHDVSPGGWRDDELSEGLVISGKVLDGDIRLFYADASGHEGLHHWLRAIFLAIFGEGVPGLRGLSILMGTAAVPLTYLLTRRLFGWQAALISAGLLAVSFWSLMYSRSGQRQVSITVTTLLAFCFLWRAVDPKEGHDISPRWGVFALAGFFMGLGFYVYFAGRGLPLIPLAWLAYLALWNRDQARAHWRGILLATGVALLMALPLMITLRAQPEAEARVEELALPIYDARAGDFSTLGRYTITTLSMFTHDGDDEALYNIPHRPVFGALGAALFWLGLLMALIRSFGPARDSRAAFLLLWLGAGLAPGVLSVPAASLGHTILAQPVSMIFPAFALIGITAWATPHHRLESRTLAGLFAGLVLLLFGWESLRGIRDYFFLWPQDSFMRVLHHSDIAAGLRNLQPAEPPPASVAIGGPLAESWDLQTAEIITRREDWTLRAFSPEYALILPPEGGLALLPHYLESSWAAARLSPDLAPDQPYGLYVLPQPAMLDESLPLAIFENGLSLRRAEGYEVSADAGTLEMLTTWSVDRILDLPPYQLFAKPPAPGDPAGPRLSIFVQLIDGNGQRASGSDGLWVDPYTLRPGDHFLQRHLIPLAGLPAGRYRVIAGLYDPLTGQRVIIAPGGADYVVLRESFEF